jgi:hypothetical protein
MISLLLVLIASIASVSGGPIALGLCYTACNAGVVSCYGASGLVFGVSGPVGWVAWLTSAAAMCSAAQGVCMVACTAIGPAPTP